MPTIADVIKRDLTARVEGVVKVYDRGALAAELREYVVTDRIERELRAILTAFADTSQALRRGAPAGDAMGVWTSGFFGSGKSHFAKVLGHLLQNDEIDATGMHCIDEFLDHLSDTDVGRGTRAALGEIKLATSIRTVAFEIHAERDLTSPGSVTEILLSKFYSQIGLAEHFVIARLERRLQQRGLLDRLVAEYERAFGERWAEGRNDLLTIRARLEQALSTVDPDLVDREAARRAVADVFEHARLTPEAVAQELVDWVEAQPAKDGRTNHLVFVIDEVGTFIGDSGERISELNALAEQLGSKGKGKVWLIVTSQQDLEAVVDRTNFQPALVGRLNARFDLKPHLVTDGIERVVAERILKKKPAQEPALRALYQANEGQLAQLADLGATRALPALDEAGFVACYPLLPPHLKVAQDIFEALSGFRISGGVRSMISVAMDVLKELASAELGTLVSFDQVFDAVREDLLSQEYLGAAGVGAISGATAAVPEAPVDPARVLKVLWMLGHIEWVPRVPETLAKLLARRIDEDLPALRGAVEETLRALQAAGYVALDEASGAWKHLNEQERTIEQAVQDYIRPGGPRSIGVATLRRTAQQLCRDQLVTKARLSNFAVAHGGSRVPIRYGVRLDGEAIESGPEIEVRFVSPLAPGRAEELEQIRAENQAGGPSGRTVWWVAAKDDRLEARLRRHEALVKVTSDRRFIDDSSRETQDALAERRKERDELAGALVRDLEAAFVRGTLHHGGQEVELDGGGSLSGPIAAALASLLPNVYTRFAAGDHQIDFNRTVKALLNPAASQLEAVAPDLGLFDTQGGLQRESPLVAAVLEAISHLVDEDVEPTGAALLDPGERAGFRGFARRPFGWPDEIVRVVMAACLRAGAVYIERQTPTGPVAEYDYQGTEDDFLKITAFKRLTFRTAQAALTPSQVREGARQLIALGVTDVAESANALAAAIQRLGLRIESELADAARVDAAGLPLPAALVAGREALKGALEAGDPTSTVLAFLDDAARWRELHSVLHALRAFTSEGRDREYATSRQLLNHLRLHPLPASDPAAARVDAAIADIEAIVSDRAVVERWSDYRRATQEAFSAYRSAYDAAYEDVRESAQNAAEALRGGEPYANAPEDTRDAVVAAVFGAGGTMHYPPLEIDSPGALLMAAARHPLTSLEQARLALPGAVAEVMAGLRALARVGEPREEGVVMWSPAAALSGRRLASVEEVDVVLEAAAEELKGYIRDGFVVDVR